MTAAPPSSSPAPTHGPEHPVAPVRTRLDAGIAVLTIDYPPVNALAHSVRTALLEAIIHADEDPAVQAIIVAGVAGNFVAGAEIREFDAPPRPPRLLEVLARVEACRKPVVAAIAGHALGGGLELALACHYRCATPDAKLGLPEVRLGLLPGAGGTQRLPRLVGAEFALEMMLGGETMDAARAQNVGLIDHLLVDANDDANPADGAHAAAVRYARALVASGGAPRRLRDAAPPPPLTAQAEHAALARHTRTLRGLASGERIINCLRVAANAPFDASVEAAARWFEECRDSAASRALRHLFFAERAAGRCEATARALRRVAVIGAGTMGTGIAIALADALLPAVVIDADSAALARGRERFAAHYASQVARGRCTAADADERLRATRFTGDFAATSDCDLAIEAVFESLEVKQRVFAALDATLPPLAVLATNTSYLDVDQIAAATRRPGDVLGLHFFSPANIMKLVEVVGCATTRPEVLATGAALARRLRKLPVLVGNATGFVGNRMLQAYGRESQLLLLEGASPAQIDSALEAFGMAMGPCAVYDLAGLDVGYRARRERGDLPDDLRYFAVADRLVEAGRLGRKSGAGHYRYDTQGARHEDPEVGVCIAAEAARLGVRRGAVRDETIVERCILALIVEGAALLEAGIARCAADIDVVWVNGYGFPRYRGGPMHYAAALGAVQVAAAVARLANEHGARYWRALPAGTIPPSASAAP